MQLRLGPRLRAACGYGLLFFVVSVSLLPSLGTGQEDELESGQTGERKLDKTMNQESDNGIDDEPLSFGFIKNPPGQLVSVNTHRLHVNCLGEGEGEGDVTVLFESGLGGSSLEWLPIQKGLAARARTCAYDRAGYAWSDPSPFPRSAAQIAREARTLLRAMKVSTPLILVGHSFGGFIVRMLALQPSLEVIALVLIESSHEDQFERMESAGGMAVMPTSDNFVISHTAIPENLPTDIKRKMSALSRMRKSYAATHGEMSSFRHSARQVKHSRQLLDIPVVVMVRGKDPFNVSDPLARERNEIWRSLQQDLVSLSNQGVSIVAQQSGHHVHVDEPDLVIETIEGLLGEYKPE